MTKVTIDSPQFYLTAPAPCPYIPGRLERKVFTHLAGRRAGELHDLLTLGGFRRSQNIAYRPACEGCRSCVSVRVLVDEFKPSRNQARVVKRNADLVGAECSPSPTADQYALFRDYLDMRHANGGMAEMSVLDYSMMVEDTSVETMLIEYRRRGPDTSLTGRGDGELLAVCLTDALSDGLSMVYSFFDPNADRRSLGTFMILDHIERSKKRGLSHLYLGYWVSGSPKMDYKARFLPQEHLDGGGWTRIDV